MNEAGKQRCELLQNMMRTEADLQNELTRTRMMGLLCHCSAEIDQGTLLYFSVHNMYLGSGDYILLLFSEISKSTEEQQSGLDVYSRMMVYHLIEEEMQRILGGHMTLYPCELDGRLVVLIQFQFGLLPALRRDLQETIAENCIQIAENCRTKYDIHVVTYISDVIDQLSVIASTYHKMLSLATLHRYINRAFEVPCYRLIHPDAEDPSPIRFPYRENARNAARAIAQQGDYRTLLTRILADLAAQPMQSVDELKRSYGTFFENLCDELQLRGVRLNVTRMRSEMTQNMDGTAWSASVDWMLETADAIAESCRTTQQSTLIRHLTQVEDYIQQHIFDPELSVKSISDGTGISTTSINVMFRNQVRITPARYIRLQRLELSRKLLEETSLTIDEIADQCGFGSLATFHRVFKAEYDITPGRFRQLSVMRMREEAASDAEGEKKPENADA